MIYLEFCRIYMDTRTDRHTDIQNIVWIRLFDTRLGFSKTFEMIKCYANVSEFCSFLLFYKGNSRGKKFTNDKMKMKGEVDILVNFPIDTSLKKKVQSALVGPGVYSQYLPRKMAILMFIASTMVCKHLLCWNQTKFTLYFMWCVIANDRRRDTGRVGRKREREQLLTGVQDTSVDFLLNYSPGGAVCCKCQLQLHGSAVNISTIWLLKAAPKINKLPQNLC